MTRVVVRQSDSRALANTLSAALSDLLLDRRANSLYADHDRLLGLVEMVLRSDVSVLQRSDGEDHYVVVRYTAGTVESPEIIKDALSAFDPGAMELQNVRELTDEYGTDWTEVIYEVTLLGEPLDP